MLPERLSLPKPTAFFKSSDAVYDVPLLYKSEPDMFEMANMSAFLAEVDEAKSMIYNMRAAVSNLSRLHSQYVRTTEEDVERELAEKIKSRRDEISALGSQVRTKLIDMNARNKTSMTPGPEFDIRKSHIQSIHVSFQGILKEYNTVEKDARDSYKERAERQFKIVKPDATREELGVALEDRRRGSQIFGQAIPRTKLISSRQSGARTAFAHAQQTRDELLEIEETIIELAKMMNDLATLVFNQDDAVQDIESKAIGVEKDVEAGLVHIGKAKRLAAMARKMRWWCFGFFLIILVVVVSAVAVQVSKH
ncbi:hypothetical protein P7C70_g7302, partial [Phenoliferia sp. Uapishka_3]